MNIVLKEINETINSLNKHNDFVEYINKNHKTIRKIVKNVLDCYLIDGYIRKGDDAEPIDIIKDNIVQKLDNSTERLSTLIQLKTPENLMIETYAYFTDSLKEYCEYSKNLYPHTY
jgi:hypothetical protein